MPVPGPRAQRAPLPGYRNPEDEMPTKFNRWERPGPVSVPGRSPATMRTALRGNILAPGTVRRFWRQIADIIPAQAPYSWTASSPVGRPIVGVDITTAVRYMTRNLYARAGTDETHMSAMHTTIHPSARSKPVTTPAGAVRSRPTIRNRLTSFGSRVPPLNAKVTAAQ